MSFIAEFFNRILPSQTPEERRKDMETRLKWLEESRTRRRNMPIDEDQDYQTAPFGWPKQGVHWRYQMMYTKYGDPGPYVRRADVEGTSSPAPVCDGPAATFYECLTVNGMNPTACKHFFQAMEDCKAATKA